MTSRLVGTGLPVCWYFVLMIDIAVFMRLRKEKRLSQQALANLAEVSQQLIGEIEQGRVRSTKAIYRFAAILGTSAHLLDPEIPTTNGRMARLAEELKTLDELDADLLLQNWEANVELVKHRRSGQSSPLSSATVHLFNPYKPSH